MKKRVAQDFSVLATKVPLCEKRKISQIASSFNMSIFELLRALLLLLIRYFDTETPISEEHNKMLKTFLNVISTNVESFSPLSMRGHEQQSIRGAILFLQRKDGEHPQTIAICKNEEGGFMESYNTDKMLADYLQATDPQLLRVLGEERERMEHFSISQVLHQLIMQNRTQRDEIGDEIKALFDDIRIPTGENINRDVYYRRKLNTGDYQNTTIRERHRTDI